ncbi:MAG: DsbA family protein [Candidatus Zambryskibacteria bacterium]|nr:DsbA family protein [Candidatus Zambryskibacteria bacterium]
MDTQNTIQKLGVPLAIVVAGGLIAAALYFSGSKTTVPAQPAPDTVTASGMREVDDTDHIVGSPNAELVIVEYSDTECPFCKQFHSTMRKVMDTYGKDGKVAWVYRHFPIDQLHSKARKQAEATECAQELGGPDKFWAYTNTLYERTPSNNGLDDKQLPIIAKDVGLDVAAFNECLSSGRKAAIVEAHYQDGVKAGARGTPYSIIISKKDGSKVPINGAQPYENLKGTIDLLLK